MAAIHLPALTLSAPAHGSDAALALLASWRLIGFVLARSFPPIAAPGARRLILGSMPGVASLEAQQYYAHPRNAFWPIAGELFGAAPELPYERRCERLCAAGVAVWDVLRSCRREGSLDTAIQRGTEEPNDFAGFFASHPAIRLIAFNGQKAETAFRRHALPTLATEIVERLTLVRLPSTSPAHAARSFEEKLSAWRQALDGCDRIRRINGIQESRSR